MKILIVEDASDIRDNLALLLRMEGFEPLEATNGVTGLALARQYLPDLILSDVIMPELDGYGFLEALRADPATASIPFIFLTGKTDRAQRRRGMNLGADDYLGKPFTRDEILDAVNARMKRVQVLEKTGPQANAKPEGEPPTIKGYRIVRRWARAACRKCFLRHASPTAWRWR